MFRAYYLNCKKIACTWPQCYVSSCEEVLRQCRTYFSPNVIEHYVVSFELGEDETNPQYLAYFSLKSKCNLRMIKWIDRKRQSLDLVADVEGDVYEDGTPGVYYGKYEAATDAWPMYCVKKGDYISNLELTWAESDEIEFQHEEINFIPLSNVEKLLCLKHMKSVYLEKLEDIEALSKTYLVKTMTDVRNDEKFKKGGTIRLLEREYARLIREGSVTKRRVLDLDLVEKNKKRKIVFD